MKRKKVAELVRVEVERAIALEQATNNFHTITVYFDNRSLVIPFEPWRPRTEARIPGTWTDPEAVA